MTNLLVTLRVEFHKILQQHLGHPPTPQQDEVLGMLSHFVERLDSQSCFILKGYAGTGKTTIISALTRSLSHIRKKSVLLAPTGRAAKVMSAYSQKTAFTIHKKIYRKKNAATLDQNYVLADNLHKDTVYGKYHFYNQKDEKVGTKFDKKTIEKVANPLYRRLLFQRLEENGNDPKKAFGGKNVLRKKPIFLDNEKKRTVPEKVKLVWLEEDYSIRKDITPDNFKNEKSIDKVLDVKIRKILKMRLTEFRGDAKKAFSDLVKNPMWLNKEKGIAIKRVAISGVKNAEVLHYKKDHHGKLFLDKNGNKVPVDFVSTGNNHHVAIYRDEKGNLQENVIPFFEAVERVNQGLPIIDKSYNQHLGWEFLFTMKQNELFVFPNEETGFIPEDIDLLDPKNRKMISPNLFRVQKFTIRDYFFRHHLETTVDGNNSLKGVTWKREGLNGISDVIKVRTNHLGDIVQVGEY